MKFRYPRPIYKSIKGSSNSFGVGDIVRIRKEEALAKVVMPIQDEDGSWWYEVEAVGLDNVPTREVKEKDLTLVG